MNKHLSHFSKIFDSSVSLDEFLESEKNLCDNKEEVDDLSIYTNTPFFVSFGNEFDFPILSNSEIRQRLERLRINRMRRKRYRMKKMKIIAERNTKK